MNFYKNFDSKILYKRFLLKLLYFLKNYTTFKYCSKLYRTCCIALLKHSFVHSICRVFPLDNFVHPHPGVELWTIAIISNVLSQILNK